MTSLPIVLTIFTNCKMILRVSGLPKLNIIRYIFWKLFSQRIYKVTCPTIATYEYLLKKKIFPKNKLLILRDPIIELKNYSSKKFEKINDAKLAFSQYVGLACNYSFVAYPKGHSPHGQGPPLGNDREMPTPNFASRSSRWGCHAP